MKHLLLLLVVLLLRAEPGRCQEDASFARGERVLHVAVTADYVYVSTEENLFQLSRDLTPIRSLSQKGKLEDTENVENAAFDRDPDAPGRDVNFWVNVLLPFVENRTLIICGMTGCGYCELRDLANISKLVYKENFPLVPPVNNSGSVAFLVNVKRVGTFILAAIPPDAKSATCTIQEGIVKLHDTDSSQGGGIFAFNDAGPITQSPLEDFKFVDGFQINSTIYLLASNASKVLLQRLTAERSKLDTVQSIRNATLLPSNGSGKGNGSRLLASSVVPSGPPVLWVGVFSARGPENTELLLFDFSSEEKNIKPKAVLFRKSSMTSVLAVTQKTWLVLFIWTGDGQLIKLPVDAAHHTLCPKVIYKADQDRRILPGIFLEQRDRKHVFVAFREQVIRVPVSRCSTHTTPVACWSSQDPYCGWCSHKKNCTFEDECPGSIWFSIPADARQQRTVSHQVQRSGDGQISLHVQTHLSVAQPNLLANVSCRLSIGSGDKCTVGGHSQGLVNCTCKLSGGLMEAGEIDVTIQIDLGTERLEEKLRLTNCSAVRGLPSFSQCRRCVAAGCSWSDAGCSWATGETVDDSVCTMSKADARLPTPEIFSIDPSVVSFYGRNHVLMRGRNLGNVTRVRIQADMDCNLQESLVWNNTGASLTFHVLRADKGTFKVCAVLPDGSCHGNAAITYRSLPSCTSVWPNSTWASGKRTITIVGSHLEFVEGVEQDHARHLVPCSIKGNRPNLLYETPPADNLQHSFSTKVRLKVANQTLTCPSSITYHPDPEFRNFAFTRNGDNVRVTVQKKEDNLAITTSELEIQAHHDGTSHPCVLIDIQTSNGTDSVICEIKNSPNVKIEYLMIKFGGKSQKLEQSTAGDLSLFILLILLLIPGIVLAVVVIYRSEQEKLTAKMNAHLEDLELNIRNEIRQGFVDLQTEKADLMENVGAIPFLDYKHFACRIFFPENEALATSCVKDIGQRVQPDEFCQALSKLIQDQVFLTSMVHTLEEQKTFSIADKCTTASLLTVALHGHLSYLTEVMEVLLRDLMQQNSNAQAKLLLRRTASIVEKLLTNWMSICLYGFLRECVGQHLFLMVSALTQQIAKGPVDSVTEKALYTLSEDWLLWQAPDFTAVRLRVLFAVGSDGELSEPLEVEALTCDTVQQLREKILGTFRSKFGFRYGASSTDIRVELERDGRSVCLEEVDAGSQVVGEVTMLNTLKHYQVPDGASLKVLSGKSPPLSPQGSLRDDADFSGKYFHLIDPDVVEERGKSPEKKKLKLKEVHLTKLLSTKVAVHSYVENLFASIWGSPHSRTPHAIKYFFDFLDGQAEDMKISDPDVLHIWKTNSLPLRFWVNILKNPQFVFDMEKTPHLDGCLSVIAQAFMDSFSLSDSPLGKHSPTNKLLYAKDIPKYRQEVRSYYKRVKDQQPITDLEFRDFLREESKKHDNEFNEATALRELYKYIRRYFAEIKETLESNGAPAELKEQLQHVKSLADGLKSCSWD